MSEYIIKAADWAIGYNGDSLFKDAEEIVRCRDCMRFIPQGTYLFNGGTFNKDTCNVIRGFVAQINPDGYCAWGERRGE